jgi:hypothetical protein
MNEINVPAVVEKCTGNHVLKRETLLTCDFPYMNVGYFSYNSRRVWYYVTYVAITVKKIFPATNFLASSIQKNTFEKYTSVYCIDVFQPEIGWVGILEHAAHFSFSIARFRYLLSSFYTFVAKPNCALWTRNAILSPTNVSDNWVWYVRL